MAGAFGKLYKAAWDDDDFKALSIEAQHAYMMFISAKQITFAGVAPFVPTRFVGLARNMTEKKFNTSVRELEKARFIVVDRKTQEVLLRTYIKHDDSLRNSKLAVAVGKAVREVYSPVILRVIAEEMAKLLVAHPDLAGWEKLAETAPDLFAHVADEVVDPATPRPKKPDTPSDAPSDRASQGASQAPPDDAPDDPSDEGYQYPIRYPMQ